MASTNKSQYTIAAPAALKSAASGINGSSSTGTAASARQKAQPSTLSEGSQTNGLGNSAASGSGSMMTTPKAEAAAPVNPDTQWLLTNGYTAKEGDTTLSGPGTVMAARQSSQTAPVAAGSGGETASEQYTANSSYTNRSDSVAAREYVNNLNLGGSVQWDPSTGSVNIMGHTVIPDHITESGIAYVPKSQIDAVAAAYKQQTGQLTPQEVMNAYEDRYGGKYETALNTLLNREAFSYDPESDPAYQSYRNQYTRNAEAALRATLNNANSDAGGSTGARAGEALAAYYNQMSKLNDAIPTLEQNAYNRYLGENDRLRSNLSDLLSAGSDYYDKYHTQYTDARNAALADREYTDNQQQQIWQNNETALNNAASRAYQEALTDGQGLQNEYQGLANEQQRIYNGYYPQMAETQIKSQVLANAAAQLDNTLTGAYSFGAYPTDPETEELLKLYGYTKQPDGTYIDRSGQVRTPWYNEGQYTDAMGKIQNSLEVDRQRALMQLGL